MITRNLDDSVSFQNCSYKLCLQFLQQSKLNFENIADIINASFIDFVVLHDLMPSVMDIEGI